MRINIARRGSTLWQDCAELAKLRYWKEYQAKITPSPDCFVAVCDDGPGDGAANPAANPAPVACAGLTYGGTRSLLIESYLDAPAVDVVAGRTRGRCEAADLIEVGPLASREAGAGLRLLPLLPALCWCNGASYGLCTVTAPLMRTLERRGIAFTVLAPAREDRLPASQRGKWGSYYATSPVAGYVDLRPFDAAINKQAELGYHLAVTWPPSMAPSGEKAVAQ
jgi:hypothetical protein